MAPAAFDTLSLAQRLERDFDFPPKHAEDTALLLYKHVSRNFTSKEDISALEKRLNEMLDIRFATSEAKFDSRFDERIAELKCDVKWIKTIGAIVFASAFFVFIVMPLLIEIGAMSPN